MVCALLLLAGCGMHMTFPWSYHCPDAYIAIYYKSDMFLPSLQPRNQHELLLRWNPEQEYAYDSEGEDLEIYKRLCEKNGDISYGKRVLKPEHEYPGVPQRQSYYHNILSIEVVSDRDYDSEHPAGASLGDIVKYYANSFEDFIENGYQHTSEMDVDFNFTRISGLLNEIPDDGLCLLEGFEMSLEFPEDIPDSAAGEHNLTIAITTDDGTLFVLEGTRTLGADQ